MAAISWILEGEGIATIQTWTASSKNIKRTKVKQLYEFVHLCVLRLHASEGVLLVYT